MHILDTDVSNRISKQAFAEAYDVSLRGQSGSARKLPRAARKTSFAPIFPMNDSEQEGHKKSGASISDYLSSLCQVLEQQSDRIAELQTQQSDRIAELQTQQRQSMMQLQEAMKNVPSS